MQRKDRFAVVLAVAVAISTVALSMVLNSWAFTKVLNGWFGYTAGVLLPLWVLALTYIGHWFWQRGFKPYAGAAFTLAGFLLVVSMPHLSSGYGLLGLHPYECWALAVVTDVTQVVAKLQIIAIVDRKANAKPAKAAVRSTSRRKARPAVGVAA